MQAGSSGRLNVGSPVKVVKPLWEAIQQQPPLPCSNPLGSKKPWSMLQQEEHFLARNLSVAFSGFTLFSCRTITKDEKAVRSSELGMHFGNHSVGEM
jgi:hypothetical protein